MIKLIMQKNYLHNNKIIDKNFEAKYIQPTKLKNSTTNVNINQLLNRVKINEQNQKKEKIIFLGCGILLISLMGFFISIVK